jgi:hypothetical protein
MFLVMGERNNECCVSDKNTVFVQLFNVSSESCTYYRYGTYAAGVLISPWPNQEGKKAASVKSVMGRGMD